MLPVVRRMFPFTACRASAHFAESSKYLISAFSPSAAVLLFNLKSGTSLPFAASLMFSLTSLANGCVASTTAAKSPLSISAFISSVFFLPSRILRLSDSSSASLPVTVATETLTFIPFSTHFSASSLPSLVPPNMSILFILFLYSLSLLPFFRLSALLHCSL